MLSLYRCGSGRQWAAGVVLGMALFGVAGCGGGASPMPGSLVGSWGGDSTVYRHTGATLNVTAQGAVLVLPCYQINLSQPIQPDSTGRFTTQGTLAGLNLGPSPIPISGRVTGRYMTVTTDGEPFKDNYSLAYGAKPAVFEGGCGD